MKKQKQKPRQRRRKPIASQLKRQRNKVLDLTAQGKNRAVVAATIGVGVNRLREDYALESGCGAPASKRSRKGRRSRGGSVDDGGLSLPRCLHGPFHSHWQDPQLGNLIFAGTDGKGGRTIEDMFAAHKQRGGRYNVTGLSTRFNEEKAIQFAKIASDYRNKFER